jgi:hypothetical protein
MPVISGGNIIGDAPDFNFADAGGDSPSGLRVTQEVLSGTGAFRQGALKITLNRAADEADSTWDGNPDTAVNISATNRATGNAADEHAVRGLQVMARNRGTEINWILGANVGSRNDSGMSAVQVHGIDVRAENYGTLDTEIVGIDVNLSCESDTGSPSKYGIHVRNTDQSAQGAVDAAIKISHTSTNGFNAVVEAAAATGDGFVVSTSTPSSAATHAMIVKTSAGLAYIPCYAATTF